MNNDTPHLIRPGLGLARKRAEILGNTGNRGATSEFSQSQRLERLAEWIESKGLCTPAILFLEASKPLAPIGGQLLLLAQPLIGSAASWWNGGDGDQALAAYSRLLESPDAVERLLARLVRARASDPG